MTYILTRPFVKGLNVGCILSQQERGIHVSTEAWERAVKEAETLVTLAERKFERKTRVFATRIAKLQVLLYIYYSLISWFFNLCTYLFCTHRTTTKIWKGNPQMHTKHCMKCNGH